ALVEAGRIDSAAPIIGMQWLAMNRERLRRQWG
ncbi:MAG: ADP-ribose diphosphatase, partial [Pseudomonadota bacterium]